MASNRRNYGLGFELFEQELEHLLSPDNPSSTNIDQANEHPNGLQDATATDHGVESAELDAEDNANSTNFIPPFVKPNRACDYCRSRGLDCLMHFGKITCKACDSLFQPCSFACVSHSGLQSPNPAPGAMDTLPVVQEDVCTEQRFSTGVKLLRSNGAPAGVVFDENKASRRFPRAAIRVLRDWFDAHQSRPYPTEEEKADLAERTDLKIGQVNTWLANHRRRTKAFGPSAPVPIAQSTGASQPVDMATASQARAWQDLNPLERWQHSPPENDPAPINAIVDAIAASEIDAHSPSDTRITRTQGSSSGPSLSAISARRARSIASTETLQDSSNSRSASASIVLSHGSGSSAGSYSSFGSGLHGKKDRQRKRRVRVAMIKNKAAEDKKRIYQCTFCCDAFKTKFDWTRHEKSLHLSLEKWICAPLGPFVADPDTGVPACVYCRAENPTEEHIAAHNHRECGHNNPEHSTFYRKDHLRQHLRLVHHSELLPSMNSWKASADFINSRCGFCSERFASWAARNEHLAAHFKEGAMMRDWKRCRGFDPEVAAMVTNAMPPYLIGMEKDSPVPFSASLGIMCHSQRLLEGCRPDDQEGWPETSQTWTMPAVCDLEKATCWEILTIELGRYVKSQADQGIIVTDEMLQSQARQLIYESDDCWNQTAADNPEWLDLFKKAHGFDMIPSRIGGVGETVPDDLELYIDLGMRIPFSVQQKRMQAPSPNTSGQPSINSVEHNPLRESLGWQSYDAVPIAAERAAHFARGPRHNPLFGPAAALPSSAPTAGNSNATSGSSAGGSLVETVTPEQRWAEELGREVAASLGQGHGAKGLVAAGGGEQDGELGGFDPLEFLNVDMMDMSGCAAGDGEEFVFGEMGF